MINIQLCIFEFSAIEKISDSTEMQNSCWVFALLLFINTWNKQDGLGYIGLSSIKLSRVALPLHRHV